jgi:protoporphyrinogen oxidase
MARRKAVILGGGFAGLWMACQLIKQGFEVEILEKEAEIGGHLRTFQHESFFLDFGPHIYFASHRHHYDEYLAEPLQPLRVFYGFGFKNRQIRSPLTPKNLYAALSLPDAVRLTASVAWNKACRMLGFSHRPERTSEDWCLNKYGRKAYEFFFRDYIPKVMGRTAEEVTPEWGTERERFYKEHNPLQRSFKAVLKFFQPRAGKGEGLKFFYAPKGSVEITRGMARFVQEHGNTIRTGAFVKSLQLNADGQLRQVTYTVDGAEQTATGDVFVNTLPITELVKRMEPASPPAVAAAHGLKYRHVWFLYYVINRPFLTDKIQIYFPETKYLFKRVYEVHPLNEEAARTKTSVCVEVGYSDDDEVSRMPESEISRQVMEQLCEFYQLRPEEFGHRFTYKLPFAYASYGLEYRDHLAEIANYLHGIDNLVSYGRPALFRYNALTDRIIDMSHKTLEYLVSGRKKREFLPAVDPKGDFL